MSKKQKDILKIVGAVGGAIFAIGVAWGTNKKAVSDAAERIDIHERRIDNVETHMVEQRTDIKWIRKALENR